MDRHPTSRACWFAAIPGAQKVKDVEDCLKNTAAPPLNITSIVRVGTDPVLRPASASPAPRR